jgi:hypothetical protein
MTKSSWQSTLLIVVLLCSVASLAAYCINFIQTGHGNWGYTIPPFILAVYAVIMLRRLRAARHSYSRTSRSG